VGNFLPFPRDGCLGQDIKEGVRGMRRREGGSRGWTWERKMK
jgi:hypothetical protein